MSHTLIMRPREFGRHAELEDGCSHGDEAREADAREEEKREGERVYGRQGEEEEGDAEEDYHAEQQPVLVAGVSERGEEDVSCEGAESGDGEEEANAVGF